MFLSAEVQARQHSVPRRHPERGHLPGAVRRVPGFEDDVDQGPLGNGSRALVLAGAEDEQVVADYVQPADIEADEDHAVETDDAD